MTIYIGREVQIRASFFYVDNGLIASTRPEWLQGAFDTLTGLFDQVGLQTNIVKTVGMLCCPFRAFMTHLEEAYKRSMIGAGLTYRARQRLRVWCPDCTVYLASGSLSAHYQTQHTVGLIAQWENPAPPPQGVHRHIVCTYRARRVCGSAQSRGAREGH